jgi:hypothetical protein
MDAKPLSVSDSQYDSSANEGIKVATPDIILLKEQIVGVDIMADLVFENIGGQEIISIARSDTINGQNVVYQPIKNITSLNYQYSSQNLLPIQKTDKDLFKNFAIDLSKKLPNCGEGFSIVDNEVVSDCRYIYVDELTGNMVIDLVNILPSEEVQVQSIAAVTILNDTIY